MRMSIIRHVVWAWQDWRFDTAMSKKYPQYAELVRRRKERQRRHGRVSRITARLSSLLHAELRREVDRKT